MATTVFSNGTVILPAWLEDVDALVYGDSSPPLTPIRVFAGAPSGTLSIASTGRITNTAPTSGTALTITAFAGALAASFAAGPTKLQVTTVASLLAAATAGAGAKAFVTDATVTTFASNVAGGGANTVPVYSDGTNWKIG
jgi:hypothetical protein